jgi:hypothetical protein
MALSALLRCLCSRLVIVNPASSFSNSPWPQLGPLLANAPAEVYKFLPFALAPVMANPITMALNDVDQHAPLPQQASELLYVSALSSAAPGQPVCSLRAPLPAVVC